MKFVAYNLKTKLLKLFNVHVLRKTKYLPDGELNPGLPRDRRGYSPLYYRGFDDMYGDTYSLCM